MSDHGIFSCGVVLTKSGLKPMSIVCSMPDAKSSGGMSWNILLTPSTCISQLDSWVGDSTCHMSLAFA